MAIEAKAAYRIAGAALLAAITGVCALAAPRTRLSKHAEREKAIQGIENCLQRNRGCKHEQKYAATLVAFYQQGDKTVLPTLLWVAGLGPMADVYRGALIGDPEGFLNALSPLPKRRQWVVCTILSGEWKFIPRARFEAMRTALQDISASSPNYQLAQACLLTIDTQSASFLVRYFPPHPFTGVDSHVRVRWYSSAVYALQDKPLWPPASPSETVYRVLWMPSRFGDSSVTLTVGSDGRGQIEFKCTDRRRERVVEDTKHTATPEQVAELKAALNETRFWQTPTDQPPSSFLIEDGAFWVMEGVRDGKYHIVYDTSPGQAVRATAAMMLLRMAGQTPPGGF